MQAALAWAQGRNRAPLLRPAQPAACYRAASSRPLTLPCPIPQPVLSMVFLSSCLRCCQRLKLCCSLLQCRPLPPVYATVLAWLLGLAGQVGDRWLKLGVALYKIQELLSHSNVAL